MTFQDILGFLFYAILFYFIIKKRCATFHDPLLKRYHVLFYWFKVISCFALTAYVVFLSPSDAFGIFYPEAKHIQEQIIADPSKVQFFFTNWQKGGWISLVDYLDEGYFFITSNLVVIKILVALCFISFNSFLTASFLFSLFSFEGMWRLFLFFYKINPEKHKITAICFLFLPTTVFWTSGIVKEAISFACLGFISLSAYNLYVEKKQIILNISLILLFSILLFAVKSYTLVAYIPLLSYFLISLKSSTAIKNYFARLTYRIFLFSILSIVIYFYIDANPDIFKSFAIDSVTEQISNQANEFKKQADEATSSFNLGTELDPTPIGLLKAAPFALVASLFRPFIWEAKKISTLLSAIESLAFFVLTLWVFLKCGIFYTLKKIFSSPGIFYCFMFSIVFAIFCGLSTLNFGSLVRYKLPALPFYAYAFLLVFYSHKKSPSKSKN